MKSILFLLLLSPSAGAGVLDLIGAVFENSNAQFRVGFLLDRKGKKEEAIHWYKKSADQQNAEAANRLGLLYEEEDRTTALSWHKRAIKWGTESGLSGFSAFSLKKRNKSCFHFGTPVIGIPSPQAASALRLGYLYQKGDNEIISHNPEQAQHFYQKAYFLGVSPLVIGEMYELIHKDLKSAVEWYDKEKMDKIQAFYKMGRALKSDGEWDLSAEFYKRSIEQYDEAIQDQKKDDDRWLDFEEYEEELEPRDSVKADELLSKMENWFGSVRRVSSSKNNLLHISGNKKNHLKESALALAWFHYRGQLKTDVNKNKASYFFLRARIFDPESNTALLIAQSHQALYEKNQSPEDLPATLKWYRKAHKAGEMSQESYTAKMAELSAMAAAFRNSGDSCQSALSQ